MIDDDAWMVWIIKKYDTTEDPDLRAALLLYNGILPEFLASERRRLAAGPENVLSTEKASATRGRRASRVSRRPTTPRHTGGPHTSRKIRTQRLGTTGRALTVTTTITITITTVTISGR